MATALLQSIDFKIHELGLPELILSGIPGFDAVLGGIPRGSVTDIFGPASSGRTSLLFALLAQTTAREEFCAVVDASDAFDPTSPRQPAWRSNGCCGFARVATPSTRSKRPTSYCKRADLVLWQWIWATSHPKLRGVFRWLRGTGCGARWRIRRRRWW